jgi:hypothetical protein
VLVTVILFPKNWLSPSSSKHEQRMIDSLKQIYDAYECYRFNHGKPPTSIKDLDEYSTDYPLAMASLQSHECRIVWNVGDSRHNNGNLAILVYEADALDKGGWIWTTRGEGMKLSSEEIRAALRVGDVAR